MAGLFGVKGREWLAIGTERSMSGIAGSLVLGILLGSTGTVGAMLGLPLEIRHVSFSAANVALALGSVGFAQPHLGLCVVGLVAIGVTNLL